MGFKGPFCMLDAAALPVTAVVVRNVGMPAEDEAWGSPVEFDRGGISGVGGLGGVGRIAAEVDGTEGRGVKSAVAALGTRRVFASAWMRAQRASFVKSAWVDV